MSQGSKGHTVRGLACSPGGLWQVGRVRSRASPILPGCCRLLAWFSVARWIWAPLWDSFLQPSIVRGGVLQWRETQSTQPAQRTQCVTGTRHWLPPRSLHGGRKPGWQLEWTSGQILLSNWNVCNPMFLKSLLQNPNCHVWYIFLLCSLEKLHWANALQNRALQHEKYLCTESVRVEGEELSGTPGQACNRRATRGPSSLRRKLPSTAARAGGRAPARSVAAVCV